MRGNDLRVRWCGLVGGTDRAEAAGADLLRRWSEPHRRYHTEAHLRAVLTTVEELLPSEPDADRVAVELAAWFHDAVYDPRKDDNENESAALAEDTLSRLGCDATRVRAVAALVRMTKTHEPVDASGRVLADADLAVLARPASDYDAYVAAVREEYSFVPDGAWRRGRAAVLEQLLARTPMYATAPMQPRTRQARANLARELAELRRR